ncbi:MAG: hypothetical protein ACM3WP_24030 [Acidobacteriota bacterium]
MTGKMIRLKPAELDTMAARLEEITAEADHLRETLRAQVEQYGSVPPRAEKSRRLAGILYQFTVTRGLTTDVKDAEVERIRENCPGDLFAQLFTTVTRYKVAGTAMRILADRLPPDSPRNLRLLFNRAVVTTESTPKLRVEKIECPALTAK